MHLDDYRVDVELEVDGEGLVYSSALMVFPLYPETHSLTMRILVWASDFD
jgi:hypothetical protein